MARFRATIHGNRGMASRLGSKDSGIQATVNGWDVGVKVIASVEHEVDCIDIYINGGSNGSMPGAWLGTVKLDRSGKPEFTPAVPSPYSK